jgi:hypothetical protein
MIAAAVRHSGPIAHRSIQKAVRVAPIVVAGGDKPLALSVCVEISRNLQLFSASLPGRPAKARSMRFPQIADGRLKYN